MLKNIDVLNETFIETVRKKSKLPAPGTKEKDCDKNRKLTGLSNSGG